MTGLRVLHVNTERTWRGGEAQTMMLARGLVQHGHHSLLAVPHGSAIERAGRQEGLEVRPLPMRGEFSPAAILGLANILRTSPVDVLHYHTSHAVSLGTLAGFFAGRRPAVLTRRVSFSLRRNPLARVKYTFRIDHLIAVAESVRWVMIAEGIAPERVSVIHSGIDLSRFGAPADRAWLERETGVPQRAVLVGCVGHLAPHKGHGILLAAVEQALAVIPNLHVLVIGEGAERRALTEAADRTALRGRVTFTGFRQDIPRLMASLDLLVLPSLSGEGSPAVIKEAMACGVPVVATDLDGIREVVEEGREALLVPPGDPDRLAKAIVRACQDPAVRGALAAAGRARVQEFSADRMVERSLEIYAKVVAQHARAA